MIDSSRQKFSEINLAITISIGTPEYLHPLLAILLAIHRLLRIDNLLITEPPIIICIQRLKNNFKLLQILFFRSQPHQ